MTVHESCLIHDQPLDWCQNSDECRQAIRDIVKNIHLIFYLSQWERTFTEPGDIATFKLDDFRIHLIGKHDIRLTGKGFTGEMRFYDAAKKVMELNG